MAAASPPTPATPVPASVPASLFDVDGTLTHSTTMFTFLEYSLAERGFGPDADRDARAHLAELTESGVPREEACRSCYRLYAGLDAESLAQQGRDWFRRELSSGHFFVEETLTAFRHHVYRGELTVLVSGSLPVCLDPIAEFLGVDAVLCSRPLVEGGRYTGEIAVPMIGEAKAAAVAGLAAQRGISLPRSTAYGDHDTDLPLLRLVGSPVVVGADPDMGACAQRNGWRHITL
ncbi:HAD-IB family hydrolase [Streptomyces sp. Pv4-95]|uniref:HAD family hydrolase n=1 Tax=Streptomyces sp. Pv4-95 TaxID=3049543 RepID=UPI003892215A